MLVDVMSNVISAFVVAAVVYFVMRRKVADQEVARNAAESARAAAEATSAAKSDELARLTSANRAAADEFQGRIRSLEEENRGLRTEKTQQEERLASEKTRIQNLEEQYRKTLEAAKAEFETLSQKVLDARTENLKNEGREQLKGVVDGLAADIKAFRDKITASDVEAARNNTELKAKIVELVGQTSAVTTQACNLADAIRGEAQLTGEWGEIQLKRVLECAGAVEGQGYTYQETFFDPETGAKTKRTDFVVMMPDDRRLIIDSKTTVKSMVEYRQAQTPEAKAAALSAMIGSIEEHIAEIVRAKYPTVVPNSLPVVLMYIPVDEVYIIAMKSMRANSKEPIREFAIRNNIVLVNSASVVPVVKLVEMLWNAEKSRKNCGEIITAAQELLRRCNDFVEGFMKMGNAFEAAQASYAEAKGKLVDAPNGRSILKAAKTLIDLGVEPKTQRGKPLDVAREIAEAK